MDNTLKKYSKMINMQLYPYTDKDGTGHGAEQILNSTAGLKLKTLEKDFRSTTVGNSFMATWLHGQ